MAIKHKISCLSVLVWMFVCGALPAATVSIGSYSTLSTSITIPVVISGGEQLTDMAGLFVVGNGGTAFGSAPVPKITAVNYGPSSIWDLAPGGYTTSFVSLYPLPSEVYFPNLSLNTTGQSVPASGTLLSVTLDLSGFSLGSTFSLAMQYPPGNAKTEFAQPNGDPLTPSFINGSITIAPSVAATVTWNTASGHWSTAAGNWVGGVPAPNYYKEGDIVVFNSSAVGGTVTVAPGGVSPLSTTVNNDIAHPYVIQNSVGDLNGIKTGGLTKSGNGTLTLSGTNTYVGATTVAAGTLDISPIGSIDSSQSITVIAGANLVANHLRPTTALISGDVTIRQNGNTAGASKVETLTMTTGSKLNLKDNDFVVGTAPNFDAVRTAIIAGKTNNAASGITSDITGFGISRGFAYAYGNDPKVSSLLAGSLSGQTYDTDSVLVKYTLLGDADLDGDTDLNDLGLWSNGYTGDLGANPPAPTTFWTGGDFDYDGDTDLNDLGLWSSTYTGDFNGGPGSLVVNAPNASPEAVAILNSMGFTVVPEPSTFVLAGVGLAGLAIAARRRKK